jgi:hypothetical protein
MPAINGKCPSSDYAAVGGQDRTLTLRLPKQGLYLPDAGHNDCYLHGAAEAALKFLERLLGA